MCQLCFHGIFTLLHLQIGGTVHHNELNYTDHRVWHTFNRQLEEPSQWGEKQIECARIFRMHIIWPIEMEISELLV